MDISKIQFPAKGEIFSMIAKEAADFIAKNKEKNKPTQLRKFYNELIMWNERVQSATDKDKKYHELEPFIKMLKAKVAYANSRNHVDNNFKKVFEQCIDEIKNAETLFHAKLFIESVTGYLKFLGL